MRTRAGLAGVMLTVGLLALSLGCSREQALNVSGSTSVSPYAEELALKYGEKHPERGRVNVQSVGSEAGLVAARKGLAGIGMCSRELTEAERVEFNRILIATDGLSMVVNNSNPVKGLTVEQIRGIFTGRITNWKEVGSADGSINAITREEGSGARGSFESLVMGKERISNHVLVQNSSGAVKALVTRDPHGIGYISMGQVGTEVKAVEIDGMPPTSENVTAGKYKLSRPFLFVTKGEPGPAAQEFIDFVLSPEGQKILSNEGLVPVK